MMFQVTDTLNNDRFQFGLFRLRDNPSIVGVCDYGRNHFIILDKPYY